ncbi:MAG: hypothetical protein CVU08_02815 [Bacteroidetes bacterium HGW-Bacteroidetes-3]|jgi:hypothetical protein|nr:MAG: hypothetical protein CVU08_02815 [Bacteroidetes bacterium HGW-Bacteroidetes-3]
MKKLLFILPLFFFSLTVNAQQTEDDIYVGKSKTFGNYKGTDIINVNSKPLLGLDRNVKQIKGQSNITGTVVKVDWCEEDCLTMWVQKDDGTTVAVGTKDYGFAVPKDIVGKRINVEGIEPAKLIRERKTMKKEYQKDIQFVATGVKLFDKKE